MHNFIIHLSAIIFTSTENKYCDMQTHCQVTAVKIGDSTTTVAREQLYGHFSPVTREQATMEEMFSVRSVPRLYNDH
jgi:hypothetical protein